MFKIFLSGLVLFSQICLAGPPPVSLKAQSGTKQIPKWNLQVPFQQATDLGGIDARIETGSTNMLINPGFEASPYSTGWTASGGSSAVGTGADIGTGAQSYAWDASAASQTLTSDAVTIPAGYFAGNGQIYCSIKTAATDYTVQAWDGSATIGTARTVSASTNFAVQEFNFIVPTSGTFAIRFTSASDAAAIYIDDCYLGTATNVGSGYIITPWVAYTLVIGASSVAPTKATTTTFNNAYWRRVGDTMEIEYHYAHTNNAGTAAGTGTYYFPLPTGYAIDTSKISAGTNGTVNTGSANANTNATGNLTGYVGIINTTTLVMVIGDETQAPVPVSSTSNPITGTSVDYSFTAKVPIVGWGTGQVLNLNTLPSMTNFAAFTPTGSWSTNTTWTGFWRKDGDMFEAYVRALLLGVPDTATLTIDIPSNICPSIDTSKRTATGVGSVVWGDGTMKDDNVPTLYPVIVDYNSTTTVRVSVPNTSATYATKVAVTQAVPIATLALADDVNVHFKVPCTGWTAPEVEMPTVTQSVISNLSGVNRVLSFDYANCTSTPCTVSNISTGDTISMTKGATGVYTIDWSPDFLAAPQCFYSSSGTANSYAIWTSRTAGSVVMTTRTTSTSADVNSDGTVFCIGIR